MRRNVLRGRGWAVCDLRTRVVTIIVAAVLILGSSCGPTPPGYTPPPTIEVEFEHLLENTYQNYPYWYKGQVHVHSNRDYATSLFETCDDGEDSPTKVLEWYRSQGYHFVAITGHYQPCRFIYDDPGVPRVVYIPACEDGNGNDLRQDSEHLLAIGLTREEGDCCPNNDWSTHERLDHVYDQGALAVLAHPGDNTFGWDANKVLNLRKFHGLEIYNRGEDADTNSEAIVLWENLLSRGERVWGFASDDCHSVSARKCDRGWIVVNSDIDPPSQEDLIENIKRGNFYAVRNSGDYLTGPIGFSAGAPVMAVFDGRLYVFFHTWNAKIVYRYLDDTRDYWSSLFTLSTFDFYPHWLIKPLEVVSFKDRLYVFQVNWDTTVEYRFMDKDGTWYPAPFKMDNVHTRSGIAAAVFNDRLYVAFKGSDRSKMFYTYMDGDGRWSGILTIPTFSDPPSGMPDISEESSPDYRRWHDDALSAISYNNRLYVFYKSTLSVEEQAKIRYQFMEADGSWHSEGGIGVLDGETYPGPPAVTTANNRLYAVYPEAEADYQHLYYRSMDSEGVWSEARRIPGAMYSGATPGAVTIWLGLTGPNMIYVFHQESWTGEILYRYIDEHQLQYHGEWWYSRIDGPEFDSILEVGGVVMVTGRGARFIRFFDRTGLLKTENAHGEKFYASYSADDTRGFPFPKCYLRIEIEDGDGNVAYSQPLFVKQTGTCFGGAAP